MKIIAHRSGPTVYPEQTIASAKLAMKNNADLIEIDTRFTADNSIVISHDDNTNRVFGVDKLVKNMTKEEFLALRHVDYPDFASHLFEDYLKCKIAPLLIHVKEGGDRLSLLFDCIKEYGYEGKVVFGIEAPEDIEAVKRYGSTFPVLAFMRSADAVDEYISAGADYIRIWEAWFSEESIKYIKRSRKEAWVMAGGVEGYDVGYTNKENLKIWEQAGVDRVLLNDITAR